MVLISPHPCPVFQIGPERPCGERQKYSHYENACRPLFFTLRPESDLMQFTFSPKNCRKHKDAVYHGNSQRLYLKGLAYIH